MNDESHDIGVFLKRLRFGFGIGVNVTDSIGNIFEYPELLVYPEMIADLSG
jgi:hypothetical protein